MAEDQNHEWHPFDAEHGYEAAQRSDGLWLIRDADGCMTELTDEEFNQLRSEGANPKGLH
jgi:hypothetical protein